MKPFIKRVLLCLIDDLMSTYLPLTDAELLAPITFDEDGITLAAA